jgi:hypothetical protein
MPWFTVAVLPLPFWLTVDMLSAEAWVTVAVLAVPFWVTHESLPIADWVTVAEWPVPDCWSMLEELPRPLWLTSAVLDDAWHRFGRPLALTNVHLAGTRDNQMRWLCDAWSAAAEARLAGLDVRAVTIADVFGDVALLTGASSEDLVRYEPGAYDIRADVPRPTALSSTARELSEGRVPEHPVLASDGFWSTSSLATNAAKPARPLLTSFEKNRRGKYHRALEEHVFLAHASTRFTWCARIVRAWAYWLRDLATRYECGGRHQRS